MVRFLCWVWVSVTLRRKRTHPNPRPQSDLNPYPHTHTLKICRRTVHRVHWRTPWRASREWDDERCEVVSTIVHTRMMSCKDVRWRWEKKSQRQLNDNTHREEIMTNTMAKTKSDQEKEIIREKVKREDRERRVDPEWQRKICSSVNWGGILIDGKKMEICQRDSRRWIEFSQGNACDQWLILLIRFHLLKNLEKDLLLKKNQFQGRKIDLQDLKNNTTIQKISGKREMQLDQVESRGNKIHCSFGWHRWGKDRSKRRTRWTGRWAKSRRDFQIATINGRTS